jgi:DNA-directed RNA polymerase III subunit RPC6
LTPDERLLYHHIDQAQTEGIWSKALRARTNFIQQHVTKCLKSLENKDLIQSVMSVKHPNRKMYLLKHLRPSEDMAGGPWQSEGEFDLPLIEAISKIIEQIIQRDTCVMVPPGYNNYQNVDRAEAIAQKKAQVQGVRDIEEALPVRSVRPQVARLVTLHNPKYPTASSLRENIMASGIIKEKEIKDADMEQLLEMMVLEGRLEKVGRTNYRLTLRATETEGLNGFVDAPCGTCPVFDLCGDSGEITARTCVYFGEWLATDSEPVR